MSFDFPANESGRLEALQRYEILNTAPANFTGLPREVPVCATIICAGHLPHSDDYALGTLCVVARADVAETPGSGKLWRWI